MVSDTGIYNKQKDILDKFKNKAEKEFYSDAKSFIFPVHCFVSLGAGIRPRSVRGLKAVMYFIIKPSYEHVYKIFPEFVRLASWIEIEFMNIFWFVTAKSSQNSEHFMNMTIKSCQNSCQVSFF